MFNPRTFLNFAKRLASDGSEESEYRTAVGRAYYAVFLIAREELDNRGEDIKQIDPSYAHLEHSKVRQRFKNGRFRHDGIFARFEGLYGLRVKADYRIDKDVVTKGDVEQALEYADYVIDAFDKVSFVGSSLFPRVT